MLSVKSDPKSEILNYCHKSLDKNMIFKQTRRYFHKEMNSCHKYPAEFSPWINLVKVRHSVSVTIIVKIIPVDLSGSESHHVPLAHVLQPY